MTDPLDPEAIKSRDLRTLVQELLDHYDKTQPHSMTLGLGKNLQFVDRTAEAEVDVMIGSEQPPIIRINIDGICVMRVRLEQVCSVTIRDMRAVDQKLEDWLAGRGED